MTTKPLPAASRELTTATVVTSGVDDSAVRVQPTQVRRPWRATIRTIFQVGIPAILGLGVVAPQVVQIILDESGESLPEGLRAALLAVSAGIVAVAAILARIMAIPQVEVLLRRLVPFLAAAPKK